ncbi:MAG TPA: stage II sporulation protein M [Acidimicrobiales bacterium]|nr:stage II sporulation protein M [Acidimicrobiales bacterium]
MNLERFLAERSPQWSELETLLARAGPAGTALTPNDLQRFGELYRAAAADLAVARRSFPQSQGALRLQALVASAHGVVYGRSGRRETPREFLSRGLWQRIYQSRGLVGWAAGIMALAVVLGAIWALNEPAAASGLLPGGAHPTGGSFHGAFYGISITARGGLAVAIFVNNIEVAMLAVAGGFTFGILTAYSLAYNGALLGVLGALEWRAGGFGPFVRLVVPHGLLELSCISLSGAAGLSIARALIDPGRDTRARALANMVPMLGTLVLGTMAFLVVAGMVEGFITPWELPTAAALALGVTLAGGFWGMVAFRGKTGSSPRPMPARDGPAISSGGTPGHRPPPAAAPAR